MLVEVLADEVPYVGKRGARKELPPNQARILILMKKVRQVDDGEAEVRSTRRIYKRRDMQAEATCVMTSEPVPAPTPPTSPTEIEAPSQAAEERPRRRRTTRDEEP
jgi:hypothetical protein